MRRHPAGPTLALLASLAVPLLAHAQAGAAAPPDLSRDPTLYLVGYAHLDTEWRWEFPQVIDEYLSKTLRSNFMLFQKYPHYIFNFTGANRYMLMQEYYPADFARLKQYVAEGRWFPAGSSVEENDVNAPAAESILRQVLYGNEYFRDTFGKASDEYMLPDCFGFPASLPSILAHAGIKGFSTQKLSKYWQPAPHVGGPGSPEEPPEGIPFNVGVWTGPDGNSVIAALNPSSYDGGVRTDLSMSNAKPDSSRNDDYVWDWPARVALDGKVTGVFADYHYVGTGDIGGAPDESTVKAMEQIVTHPGGPLHVVWSDADQMFKDIKPDQTAKLPHYQGDLELINHSAGSITSQTQHKRWNRKNEILAAAAEAASVGAAWLGDRPYPKQRLDHAWRLLLTGQFHDNMAGTSTPKAYEYSWNDEVLALNQFAAVLTDAVEGVAAGNVRFAGVGRGGGHRAGFDRFAVQEDRARTAGGGVTAEVGSGQAGHVAHEMHEQGTVRHVGLDRAAVDGYGHLHWLFLASLIAAHTRDGVVGMSMWRTPRWLTASITALCMAGAAPMVPASPIPLAPSGLMAAGVSLTSSSKLGSSAAVMAA